MYFYEGGETELASAGWGKLPPLLRREAGLYTSTRRRPRRKTPRRCNILVEVGP